VLVASADAARATETSLRIQQGVSSRQADRLERLGEDATQASRDQTRSRAQGLEHDAAAAQAQRRSLGAQVQAAGSCWRAAQAQAEAARRSVTAAEATAQRAQLLVEECEIRAPRAALVDEVFVEPGEQSMGGSTLLRLIELDTVQATFYLPNAELAAAKPGAAAVIEADPWPGQRFMGSVSSVGSSAEFTPRNIQTRTDRDRLVFAIEVSIPNPGHELRPGMPVQVTLPGTER
jgi:HlyD family secretion protein